MEMDGLQSNLLTVLNVTNATYNATLSTAEIKLYASNVKIVASIIEQTGKSKDIHSIINDERIMLRHEAQFYGTNNPQALKSLNQAVIELDGASEALMVVQDKHLYQAANKTHSVKDRDRINGLPKDAFHVFTNSHKTRLGNRIRSIEASFEERLLLKERYNNMQIAQKEYMKLQAKALDITLPEKSREIER